MKEHYKFQREGIEFLKTKRRAILADEMGLGKTIQAIEASEDFFKILVIAPKTIHKNWEREIGKWSINKTVVRLEGNQKQKMAQINSFDQGYLVVNYELCRANKEGNIYLEGLIKRGFDLVIVDEAHNIKNRKSQQSIGIRKICSKVLCAYLLTGTPIVNRVDDLWPLLNLVNRKLFSSFWRFCNEHSKVTITQWGWKIDPSPKNPKKLVEMLRPFLLKRSRADVMSEIPDRIEETIWVEMTPEQRELYEECKKEIVVFLTKETKINILGTLPRITRLRQVASCPSILRPGVQSNKDERLLEIVNDLDGNNKALIFSSFNETLKSVASLFGGCGIQYLLMTGQVKYKDRYSMIDTFMNSNDHKVMLMNTSLGIGLNLTAATTVVFIDKPWSPALVEQAIARTQRKGQTKKVLVISLTTDDTIEEWVEGLLYKKENILVEIVGRLKGESSWCSG